MNYDQTNELFRFAASFVNQSSRNIFLTGKAGTGKTTFLKYIRENCPKQMAVAAPTGVAAINAGGVTIHSLFQLPLSPFVPAERGFSNNDIAVGRHSLLSRLRFTTEKRKVLQQLELLIIDEISMVRCDTLDAIDLVLRHIRRNPLERFGGVQVLFIGDMFQLPPVVKDEEWKILSEFYSSPYFFDSHVIREELPVYIEFDKIYRQSEAGFISLLNQVRNNRLDEDGIAILEQLHQSALQKKKDDGCIVLATHNEMARNINAAELNKLSAASHTYRVEVEGDFPETAYPADELLYLKEGAQVMFIKNDADKAKRFFNGKIGTVTALEQDEISVQCEGEPEAIVVKPEKWENIRYSLNKNSRQLEQEVLGSFSQFPLRLAWAITIHKSLGLTFEKAIIDAGEAFAPGQVYVALSRCTNLDGLILKSRIRPASLRVDQRIVDFSQHQSTDESLQLLMTEARKDYQEKILRNTFDLAHAKNTCAELIRFLEENKTSFNQEAFRWIETIEEKIILLQETVLKFHTWLSSQFSQPIAPEENVALVERTQRAAGHFKNEITTITELLKQCPASTDSRQHAKEFNETTKEIFSELSMKLFLLSGFAGNLDPEYWHQQKKNFVLPSFPVNAYAGSNNRQTESPHPVLHQQLRKLRDAICAKKDLPIYIVAGSATLQEMATYLPQTLPELRKISGFGDAKTEQYGQQFLDIITEYCRENNLSSLIHEKKPKRERKERTGSAPKKGDTHAESFRLFREGKTIADIAKERGLTISTIEGHLAKFVLRGDIKIEELVSPEKILLIEPLLASFEGGSVNPIKQQLGDAVSYGEIRLVIASLRRVNDI